MVEFGGSLRWTYVMGGLAREYSEPYDGLVREWLDAADASGMPVDPRLWSEGPIASTFPACMAVKAAAEQAADGGYAYLRALREGLFCFRRKLDTTEALVEEARRVRLDVERFRIDLGSHAIVEAFAADLERTRTTPGVALPSIVFSGEDGAAHSVQGLRPYDDYREAALAAGATPAEGGPPAVLEAVRRFGRMAAAEVEAVCELPAPQAGMELWRLVKEGRLRAVRVVGGYLWELA
jgi:predicted DsbA family dithiol-disulfide isomerase